MARLTDALLNKSGQSTGFLSNFANQPLLDPQYGGQHGWAPNLTQWISNQAYVKRNLVAIVLESPKIFNVLGGGSGDAGVQNNPWVRTWKAMIELHSQSIEGLNAEITVDTDTHPVGGGGELQHEFVNVTRAASEPTHTVVDKYGRPFQLFLETWIRYGMADPDTKYALVGTIEGKQPDDLLADWYTGTVLYFEPDPTHRKVVKSWIVTNMFPTGTGEISAKRELTSSMEIQTLNIRFTGLAQSNLGTNVFAQSILDEINANSANANPYIQKAFVLGEGYGGFEQGGLNSADIGAAGGVGYKSEMEKMKNNIVKTPSWGGTGA